MGYEADYTIYVKGKAQDIAYMQEKLSAIMENRDRLDDEDWLRDLFGDKYDSVASSVFNWDDFNSSWNGYEINGNPMNFYCHSYDDEGEDDDEEDPEFYEDAPNASFVDALDRFFQCLGIDSRILASGRSDDSGNDLRYYAFFGGLDRNGHWSDEEYLDAYRYWKRAEIAHWLLPDDAPSEERAEAKRKEDVAKTAFDGLLHKEKALAFIESNPDKFDEIPDEYKTSAVCLVAIREYGSDCENIPTELQSEEFFIEAVEINENGKALKYVPEEYRTEKVCLAALKSHPDMAEEILGYVPKELREQVKAALGK
jgi:hypothetical protein